MVKLMADKPIDSICLRIDSRRVSIQTVIKKVSSEYPEIFTTEVSALKNKEVFNDFSSKLSYELTAIVDASSKIIRKMDRVGKHKIQWLYLIRIPEEMRLIHVYLKTEKTEGKN